MSNKKFKIVFSDLASPANHDNTPAVLSESPINNVTQSNNDKSKQIKILFDYIPPEQAKTADATSTHNIPTEAKKPLKIVFGSDLTNEGAGAGITSSETRSETRSEKDNLVKQNKKSKKDKNNQKGNNENNGNIYGDLVLEDEIYHSEERQIVYPITSGLLLAQDYKKGSPRVPQVDPTGWWASEKYDGIRVLWDGISLWTRAMNQINAPMWFYSRLPPSFSLDGELFIKRNYFNETSGIIRNKVPNPDDWTHIKFMVFDIPHLGHAYPFENRLDILKETTHRYGEPLVFVNHIKVKNYSHLETIHQDLVNKGAEGTMIRAPRSFYEGDRSNSLLKFKDQDDSECVVVGWEEGKNKNEGRLGALEVTWEDPVAVCEKYGNEESIPYHGVFKVGSGLSGSDRVLLSQAPKLFPKGTRIRVAFNQLQKSGKPRHPAYKGLLPQSH